MQHTHTLANAGDCGFELWAIVSLYVMAQLPFCAHQSYFAAVAVDAAAAVHYECRRQIRLRQHRIDASLLQEYESFSIRMLLLLLGGGSLGWLVKATKGA